MAHAESWLVAALVVTGAAAVVPGSRTADSPPPGYTGGFGEPSCVACHIGNDVNAFDGRVTLEGLPRAYETGRWYVLTVVLEADGTDVAGFMVSSRFSDGPRRGENAGTLVPTDTRVVVTDSAGVSYAHHSEAGSRTSSSGGASWSFLWAAPRESGPVALHVAANSGNADDSPLSDLVYTTERLVQPGR